MFFFVSFEMVFLRKLTKLFRHDSMAHVHPSTKDDEVITVQRMEHILRESNLNSKSVYVKVSQDYFVCSIMLYS